MNLSLTLCSKGLRKPFKFLYGVDLIMGLHQRKLAVLDLTHGGIPIAKSLAAAGNEVTGIDVYGTVEPGALRA